MTRVNDLEKKIDELTSTVKQLRIDIKELKRKNDSEHAERHASQENKDINKTPLRDNDVCIILNNHKGLQGKKISVDYIKGKRVYFTINGNKSWRIRTNLMKIAHAPCPNDTNIQDKTNDRYGSC